MRLVGRTCFEHGLNDADITGAAAKVAGERRTDTRLIAVGLGGEQCVGGHQHARRAETALQSVMTAERSLQRRQRVAVGKTFDRFDAGAVSLHSKHQAAARRLAVDNNGTGAADTVFAANMAAGETKFVTQAVNQRQAWFDIDVVRLPVNLESGFQCWRAAARWSARAVRVSTSARR